MACSICRSAKHNKSNCPIAWVGHRSLVSLAEKQDVKKTVTSFYSRDGIDFLERYDTKELISALQDIIDKNPHYDRIAIEQYLDTEDCGYGGSATFDLLFVGYRKETDEEYDKRVAGMKEEYEERERNRLSQQKKAREKTEEHEKMLYERLKKKFGEK